MNENSRLDLSPDVLLRSVFLILLLLLSAAMQLRIVILGNPLLSLLLTVFLVWGLPGFLIVDLLLGQDDVSTVEKFVLSFVVGIEAVVLVTAVPVYTYSGMEVLRWAFLAGGTVLVVLHLYHSARRRHESSRWGVCNRVAAMGSRWLDPESIVLIVVLAAVAFFFLYVFATTVHPWLLGGDRWTYMGVIREYLELGEFPTLSSARLNKHVWGAVLAFMCEFADIGLVEMYNVYLPVILGLAAILCFQVFHQALLRQPRPAWFCSVVYLLYLCSTMARDYNGVADRGGHRLMNGAVEDKGVTLFLFLPIAMYFLFSYLRRRRKSHLALFALSVGASAVTHPLAYVFIVILVGFFGSIRIVSELLPASAVLQTSFRDRLLNRWLQGGRATVTKFALLTAVTIPFVVFPAEKAMAVVRAGSPALDLSKDTYSLDQLSQVLLDRHVIMTEIGNYRASLSLVNQPVFVLALVLAPTLLIGIRRDRAAQFLLANFLGPLAMVFTPCIASLVARVIGAYQLYRVVWVVPAAQVVGYALYRAFSFLDQRLCRCCSSGRRRTTRALGVLVVLLTVTALLSPEVAEGVKYRRQEYEKWRLNVYHTRDLQDMATYMSEKLADRTTVAAAYRILRHLPALTSKTTNFLFELSNLERKSTYERIGRFYEEPHFDKSSVEVLEEYDIRHVVCGQYSHCASEFQIAMQTSMFRLAYGNESYRLYEVISLRPTHVVSGNVYLQEEMWEQAVREYRLSLHEYPDEPAAYWGLGLALSNLDKLGEAEENFRRAVALSTDLLRILRQTESESVELYLSTCDAVAGRCRESKPNWESSFVAYDLLEQLPPPDNKLDPRRSLFFIASEPESVIFQHPPSRLPFRMQIPASSQLDFDIALAPEVWQMGKGDGVGFSIELDDGAGIHSLFSAYIDPKNIRDHRHWHDHGVDLSPWAGQTVTLTFSTGCGPNGNCDYDWAGWGEPRIVQPVDCDFVARYSDAVTSTLESAEVHTGTQMINYETRSVLFQQPTSRVTYPVTLPQRSKLAFGLGMAPDVWSPEKGDGVEYNIYVKRTEEPHKLYRVFHRYVDAKNNPDDRRWFDERVDLDRFGGESVEIIFEALPGPEDDADYDWGGWSTPVLIDETPPEAATLGDPAYETPTSRGGY